MKRSILLFCCLTVLLLLAASEGYAQAYCAPPIPPCNPNDPASKCYQPPPPPCQCQPKTCKKCTTSPAYAASGVYETDVTDLSIPTVGFPLTAARRYSSAHLVDGPTGLGWSSTFHARLHYVTYLFAAPSTYQTKVDVIMPDGEHYEFADAGGGVFTAPEGRYDSLVKNVDGSFDLTVQRSKSVLHFGADGLLASMTDDFGNALTYTYDATSGRLQRVADAAGSGRYLDVIWGPNGRIATIQDHTSRTVQYGYDTQGLLTTVTNPAGHVTTYSYVAGRHAPRLSQVKDHWNRVITDVTWDAQGRVKSYTEEGETYTYTYAYQGQSDWTLKTDSSGAVWSYRTGSAGLILSKTPPSYGYGGNISRATYNADGSVATSTDEMGVRTDYTYAGQGRIASVTKAAHIWWMAVRYDYTYDTNFPEKVTSILPKIGHTGANNPDWQGWKYDYYAPGSAAPGSLHHVYRVKNDGVTTETMATYVYDTKGRVTQVTETAGGLTDYAYDTQGNLWTVTAPSNNDAGTRPVTTYGYDALGRVTSVTDPLGKVTSYTYDALDRILTATLPKPSPSSTLTFTTTYTYDQYDAATTFLSTHVTDPNAIMTKQAYDQFGRLRKSLDALNNATQYGYTKNLLTSITDAHNYMTSYEYNNVRQLTATVFPDGKRETYTYTADGLLKTKTDRKNQTITYNYDEFKRMWQKVYSTGGNINYIYTGQKLTQVQDQFIAPNETHAFAYDSSFRVTSNTQGPRGTLTYTYLPGDLVQTMTVTGGPTTTYTYYPDGSVNTIAWTPIATGNFKYAYRLNGQYGTITFPNGQTRNYSYDDQGRLLQLANLHPTAGNLATFEYGYDLNHATSTYDRLGQRVTMTANVPNQSLTNAMTQYRYDTNYQLIQANYPSAAPFNGEVHSWTYDGIGNRLTNTVNGTTTNYTYQKLGANPNNWQRLTNDGVDAYTYDFNGNTVTQGANTFGWDIQNRMSGISGGGSSTYKYDYQGRRVTKAAGGSTTSYLFDGANVVVSSGTSVGQFLFGPGIDQPIALDVAGSISYYEADGIGSVQGLGDSSGTPRNSYTYDVWGSPKATTELISQPFRYTGREVGDFAAHYFYRARFYVSPLGRFLSEDPLGDLNRAIPARYDYVLNNPSMFTDPSGYCQLKMAAPVIKRFTPLRGFQSPCPPGHPACSGTGGSLDCPCSQCPTSNVWSMKVSMAITTTMHIPYHDPGGKLQQHEYRHYADMRDRFALACVQLEGKTYPNKAECDKECDDAKSNFASLIQQIGRQSNRHVHKTHPRD